MLVSYIIYEPEIGQFVEEIKQLKQVTYSIRDKAYKVEFNDDTFVYVPKEFRLNESLFIREKSSTDENDKCNALNDYYTIVDNRVALRDMNDITEAQLRINEMCSIEQYDKWNKTFKHVVISNKVFLDTVHKIGLIHDNSYEFVVDGYDGATVTVNRLTFMIDNDTLRNLDNIEDYVEVTSQLKENILSKIEFR